MHDFDQTLTNECNVFFKLDCIFVKPHRHIYKPAEMLISPYHHALKVHPHNIKLAFAKYNPKIK